VRSNREEGLALKTKNKCGEGGGGLMTEKLDQSEEEGMNSGEVHAPTMARIPLVWGESSTLKN